MKSEIRKWAGDEFRNWLLIAVIGLALGYQHILRAIDEASHPATWMRATVEIEGNTSPPDLRYGVCAFRAIDGVWTAVLYDAEGRRIDSRKGAGRYTSPDKCDPAELWSWHDFFTGYRPDPPAEPDEPYRVCLTYRMSLASGATADSVRFCSRVYRP
ncbi:hypothetical protein [Marinovum algicola]|uniref:hypothetical protein n=1 Tax=Marinovum algicola TaxID=42444 RepID=UPI003B51C6B1